MVNGKNTFGRIGNSVSDNLDAVRLYPGARR